MCKLLTIKCGLKGTFLCFSLCGKDVEEKVWKKIEWTALETDGLQQLKGDALQELNQYYSFSQLVYINLLFSQQYKRWKIICINISMYN